MIKIILWDTRTLIIYAVETKWLYNIIITLWIKKDTILSPDVKFAGFVLVPNENFLGYSCTGDCFSIIKSIK